ncbi:MAG: PCI domain-containing protein [Candidatus Freyarchaeota archaeon]
MSEEDDVKRKIEYYAETANLLLEEEAYDIASDFFTLAGYYSLSMGDSASAASFTEKALESCKKGNVEDHHYIFALSLKELNSGNLEKAIEYWNQTKNKYTEDEIELVERVLNVQRAPTPLEEPEEALESFLEAAQEKDEEAALEVFEEIALESAQQAPPSEETPPETVTPYWAEAEAQPAVEKEEIPQPETAVQEPEDEGQLVSPTEAPQATQPEPQPTPTEKPTPAAQLETTPPVSEPTVPQIPPQPSPQEGLEPTPSVTSTLQPAPTVPTQPAPTAGAPAIQFPPTRVSGKNIYGRIKISDIAWRIGRTDDEVVKILSNLISQGRIPGYIQGDEYIQSPGEELTLLSTRGPPSPQAEAPSRFFISSEADVTAETREGYKRCGVCGEEIPNWTKICPKCGAKQ